MIAAEVEEDLAQLAHAGRVAELKQHLQRVHPADVAEAIIDLPSQEEALVFRALPKEKAGLVFSYLPTPRQEGLVKALSAEEVRNAVAGMAPDDRARLLEEMPAEVAKRLMETLGPEELEKSRALLGYPENTAGRYMTPNYASIAPDMTAEQALRHIRSTGRGKETLNVVYIVDREGYLIEDVRLGALVLADPATPVTGIPDPGLICLPVHADRAEVLREFEKYDRVALPVVDDDRRMLGIITMDDVLDVAEQAATDEIQKMGGSETLDAPYNEVGFWAMVRKRGGWLSALFLGEMLTATAMGYYEREIERAVVLALFVPLIISSGGNSGSQATTLVIRAMALGEVGIRDWWRVIRREFGAGLVLGGLLGSIGFLRIIVWQKFSPIYGEHYLLIASTVAASLVGVVTFGTLAGSLLPFILRSLKFDPASASAPFVATLVDVTGLLIYFSVASVILRGTLL